MNDETRARVAPRVEELPRPFRELRAPVVKVGLRTITPIYGGGVHTRRVDEADVIRVPSVRGHLRWWWRALFADEHPTAKDLFEAERRRWGGIGSREARRSAIAVEVEVRRASDRDDDRKLGASGPGYALWPARGSGGEPDAQRYRPGIELELRVYVVDERLERAERAKIEAELRDCVRAWILFGGYGGRTRRGLGSLTVVGDAASWLPRAATEAAIEAVFGRPIFAASATSQIPRLAGAELYGGEPQDDAERAWAVAVEWLREFRQGVDSGARRRGHPEGWDPRRPGISSWPEPDKVRRLAPPAAKPWSHVPRHDGTATWPRAGFGLPIGGRFQTYRRQGDPQRERYTEPDDFWLKWKGADGKLRDRLASPLVLKALPLVGDRFAPLALWLHRADPPGGQVVLCMGDVERPGSAVPFGAPLVAPGDRCEFPPIAGKPSLQRAFFDWVRPWDARSRGAGRSGRSDRGSRLRKRGGSRR